jgi:hypothetical protein
MCGLYRCILDYQYVIQFPVCLIWYIRTYMVLKKKDCLWREYGIPEWLHEGHTCLGDRETGD